MTDPLAGDGSFITRTRARSWEDGLIVGSGRVGAIVWGASATQTIAIAHERCFLPANPRPAAPLIAPSLEELRERVLAGDGEGAGRLLAAAAEVSGFERDLVWTDPLGICATLELTPSVDDGPVLRRIDPVLGEVTLVWHRPEGDLTVRLVAPRDLDEIRVAVEAPFPCDVELRLGLGGGVGEGATWAPAHAGLVEAAATASPDPSVVASTRRDGRAIATTVVRGGEDWALTATADALTGTLRVPAGGRAELRLRTVPGGDGAAPHVEPTGLGDWDEVIRHQERTHGELVDRSRLDLGGDARAGETTEEIWARARAGDPAARRRVVEIAYLSGRANAISATGELPPTLQGVWQGTWVPAWSADYTMNGNVQNGGIASLIPTGTPELARSLLALLLPHLDDYRANAARVFGASGMLLPARMSTHGRANHFSPDYPHLFWTGAGGWALRVAADVVSVTGDGSIVDDALWQLAIGVLEFAETGLADIDGTLHAVPGYSPENAPVPGGSPVASDATMDIAILRDAARSTAVLAAARGDHSLTDRWARLIERLPGYRVADDGTLAEWIDPRWPQNHAHRHASHLYPLWYETDPAFQGDTAEAARLRDAARRTIHQRIAWRAEDPTAPPGRMEMAFGLVQLGVAAAALGDAPAALRCAEWLALQHWTPALTTTHDAGRIFNLDASGGLPAVVAAMLVGSDQRSVTLLPALPEPWASYGAVTGLTARGGIIIDRLEWDSEGARATLRRRDGAPAPVRVRVGDPFAMPEGEPDAELVVGTEPVTIALGLSAGQRARADPAPRG